MQKKSNKVFAACLTAAMAVGLLPSTMVFAAQPAPPTVPRLWGADRYETAIAISKAGWTGKADTVIIVRGDDFADALCVAPLARMYNAPILLTQKNELNAKVKDELKRLGVKKVYIAGGTAAVSTSVETELKKLAEVKRIAGSDRYETSASIAKELGSRTKVVLATGKSYADALSAAPYAAQLGMPILLTGKDAVPASVQAYIKNSGVSTTYVIGGTGAVSDAVKKQLPTAQRLAGNDRFGTNEEIIKSFQNETNFDQVYVAIGQGPKGNEFADALSGAALAAAKSAPIVLTGTSISDATAAFLKGQLTPKSTITILGGEAAVPSKVVDKLTISKTDYSVDSKVYGSSDAAKLEVVKDNVNVNGQKVTLQNADVQGNAYVYGDQAVLSNVKVAGIVFVDPGEKGSVTLDNVQAAAIRVKSGAQNSIHLKNVKAKSLLVESKNTGSLVRVVSEGTTAIDNTMVKSDATLDAAAGSFGTVTVPNAGTANKSVEFKGTFDKPVVVEGAATLKSDGATIPMVTLATTNPTAAVGLQGKFESVTLTQPAKVEVASGSIITQIVAVKGVNGTVSIPADATVKQASDNLALSGEGAKSVTTIPAPETAPGSTTPGGTTGGGGGGGQVTPVTITSISNATVTGTTITFSNTYSNLSSASIRVSETGSRLQLKVTKGATTTVIGNWTLGAASNELTNIGMALQIDPISTFNVLKASGLGANDFFNAFDFTSVLNAVKNNPADQTIVYDQILPILFNKIQAAGTNKAAIYTALNLSTVYGVVDSATKTAIEAAVQPAINVYNSHAVTPITFIGLINGYPTSVLTTIDSASWKDDFYSAINFTSLLNAIVSSPSKAAAFDAINVTNVFNALRNAYTKEDVYLTGAAVFLKLESLSAGTKAAISSAIDLNSLIEAMNNNNNTITLTVTSSDNNAAKTTTYQILGQ